MFLNSLSFKIYNNIVFFNFYIILLKTNLRTILTINYLSDKNLIVVVFKYNIVLY